MTTSLGDQYDALRAAAATFKRPPGSSRWISLDYPGWRIIMNHRESGAPYLVFHRDERLVDYRPCYTFDGAVSALISEVAAKAQAA